MSHFSTVQVGNICKLVNGKAFKTEDWSTNGLPIIRIQNLNDPTKPFNYWAGSLDRQVLVQEKDVLLAWSGTPGTSFGAHIWNGPPGVLNQHIFRVDLDENEVTRNWWVQAINSQLNRLIAKAHGGVGLKHVTRRMVDELEILLPPIDEQKRIAAILDQADALRCLRQSAIDKLNTLGQSIFYEMFGSGEIADMACLSDYADVTMGQSPLGESYNDEGIGEPLLNGPTEFGSKFPVERQWTTKPKKFSEIGDILFCVRGATAGRMNESDKPYCIGRGLAAITPKQSHYKEFLFSILSANYKTFQSMGVGSTFINISNAQLKEFQVPRFNEDLAEKFTGRMEYVNDLTVVAKQHLSKLEMLYASIQQRAFRGEI
jgi:type I restriction enzyme, S subunit